MVLTLSKDEFESLKNDGFIIPNSNSNHYVNLHSYKLLEFYEVEVSINEKESISYEVEVDNNINVPLVSEKKHKANSVEDINHPLWNDFLEFKSSFPSNDSFSNFKMTRILRQDKHFIENGIRHSKAFDNYIKVRESVITNKEDLLNIMLYEVNWRKTVSKRINDNKLTYMSGLTAWLNDYENIHGMNDLMKDDKTDLLADENVSIFTDL
jgi:hypothetical protein